MMTRSKKRILALVSVLCLCFAWLMPSAVAIDLEPTEPDKDITFTYWDVDEAEQTVTVSLESIANSFQDGTTWDKVPFNKITKYLFEELLVDVSPDSDPTVFLKPNDVMLLNIAEIGYGQFLQPGMHLYLYSEDALYSIDVTPFGEDEFYGLGERIKSPVSKTVYVPKNANATWGALTSDFLKSYRPFGGGVVGDWFFLDDDNITPKDKIVMGDRIAGADSFNIGPGEVQLNYPDFLYQNYLRYYNGNAIDTSDVFALYQYGKVWNGLPAYYEMQYGHAAKESDYSKQDVVIVNAGKYTVRAGYSYDTDNLYTLDMKVTVLPIPVVVEVGNATKTSGAVDPAFTATVRLDEEALQQLSSGYLTRYDDVSIETMKALIEKELGNSFFTFERDAGETNGETYEIRAVQKEGVNPYSNFQIRYVPGELKVSDDSDLSFILTKQLTDSAGNRVGDGKPFGVHLYDENKNLITSVVLNANSDEVRIDGLQSGKTYYIVEETRDYYTIEGYSVFETELENRRAIGLKVAQLPEGVSGTVRVQVNNSTEDVTLIPDEIIPLAPGVPDDIEIIEIEAEPIPLGVPATGDNNVTVPVAGLVAFFAIGLVALRKKKVK